MTNARPDPPIGVIDIGSNSLKLSVAVAETGMGIREIDRSVETVRLGEGSEARGALSGRRMDLALSVLGTFAARSRALGAERVIAVATEAVRSASNGADFIERVRRETGIDARILTADEEALFSFAGLAETADLSGDVVVADIGGASSEVLIVQHGNLDRWTSIPVGSGILTDRYVHADPPGEPALAEARAAMRDLMETSDLAPLPGGPEWRVMLTGGTGKLLLRLSGKRRRFSPDQGDALLATLAETPASRLAHRLRVPIARATLVPAGAAAAIALCDVVRPGAVEAADSGVRTGVLLEEFGIPPRAMRETGVRDPR